jgi:TIR domain
MTKPTLFISHATSDAEYANAVKQEIENVFADQVEVFCTSSPDGISGGTDWLETIENKLKKAQAIIVVVTPMSRERHWLWFEIGASWQKSREGTCRIYPLCAPEIEVAGLPEPLRRLQALSMGKDGDLKSLFNELILQFGCGLLRNANTTKLMDSLPKYENVELVKPDITDTNIACGEEIHSFYINSVEFLQTVTVTWDFLFKFIGSILLIPGDMETLELHFHRELTLTLSDEMLKSIKRDRGQGIDISEATIRQMLMQFISLGWLKTAEAGNYALTPYGQSYLMKIGPIKSKNP